MIVISNSNAQTLAPGQSLIFNTTIMKDGCDCCRRGNQTFAKIRKPGNYLISFGANIGTTTEDGIAQVSILVGGQVLPESTMISETAAAGGVNNVFRTIPFKVCCNDFTQVTVSNTGDTTINIDENPMLSIVKI